MDPLVVGPLSLLGLSLLVVPLVAGELAAARERRATAGQLDAERKRAELAERRAADAERQRDAVHAAAREYLAAVARGVTGPLPRERLRVLLDATEHAAGSAPAAPAGDDGGGHAVGGDA